MAALRRRPAAGGHGAPRPAGCLFGSLGSRPGDLSADVSAGKDCAPVGGHPASEGAGLQCARLDGLKGVVGAERLADAFTERPYLLTVSVRGGLLPDTITADGAPLSHISAITAQRVQGINGEADTSSPLLVRDMHAEVSKRQIERYRSAGRGERVLVLGGVSGLNRQHRPGR